MGVKAWRKYIYSNILKPYSGRRDGELRIPQSPLGKDKYHMKNIKEKSKALASVAVCLAAGIAGSLFTYSSVKTWYPLLRKPFFNPPGWIFAPVWTFLYLLMGLSLFIVWMSRDVLPEIKKRAIFFFGIQLLLNVAWSFLFFWLRNPFLALAEIIILWFFIMSTFLLFKKISRTAAYMLLPYLAWVTFAIILNLSIAILN